MKLDEFIQHAAKLEQRELFARYLIFFLFEDEVLGFEVTMTDVELVVDVLNRPAERADIDKFEYSNSVVADARLALSALSWLVYRLRCIHLMVNLTPIFCVRFLLHPVHYNAPLPTPSWRLCGRKVHLRCTTPSPDIARNPT